MKGLRETRDIITQDVEQSDQNHKRVPSEYKSRELAFSYRRGKERDRKRERFCVSPCPRIHRYNVCIK
jgi:hypothetical protein